MNSASRGIRNAFRNVIRTGSIVLILGLSIGLVIAMLAARQAVDDKIATVKSNVGNTISISPAGVRGFEGGGTPLTTDQIAKVTSTAHVTSVVSMLSDRMTTEQTSLQSAIEPGSFGNRQAGNSGVTFQAPPDEQRSSRSSSSTTTRTFTPPVMITGVSSVDQTSTFGGSTLTWKSGQAFDATKDANDVAIGTSIATKNNLSVGSKFTAYGATVTVVGIYDAGNTFANNGVFVSLAALQRLSSQSGAITSATAVVDSSDNLASATTAIKTSLSDVADVTNSQDTATQLVAPLESVKNIAVFSLIGAVAAGAVIILLTMMMIVRERRREIGVMKAIGASNVGIMKQFVVEAVTLTTIALVIGFGVGIAAATPLTSSLVDSSVSSSQSSATPGQRPSGPRGFGAASRQAITNIQTSVGATTLAYGVGAALLIAILGSAIPSFIISKIKPAEAMRSE